MDIHTATTVPPDPKLQALAVLEGARRALEQTEGSARGYAADLVRHFIEWEVFVSAPPTQLEADSLFRALVLDERWPVARAGNVYLAAAELAEH